MNYITVYVGMDVHKDTFTLSCYTNEQGQAEHTTTVSAHYAKVLNYIDSMRKYYGNDAEFMCGYEAGCLGYSLYHDLTNHGVRCVIVAPSTMPVQKGKKKLKTDRRDSKSIARCLAHRNYSEVHIPTKEDDQTKEYIRMRDDHKLALKKNKQQILSFCLRHGYKYDDGSNWTAKHLKWLRELKLDALYALVLEEYLLTYDYLTAKLEMLDQKIQELAEGETYKEAVSKLRCFIGIDTITAISIIVEIGDFNRFPTAGHFAAFIGLTPGEDSSGPHENKLGITKAGNGHVRKLLIESAQCFSRGKVGAKSVALKKRQKDNPPAVIEYADKANIRLRKRYYKLVLKSKKPHNVAVTAVARELACFVWGMMTEQTA